MLNPCSNSAESNSATSAIDKLKCGACKNILSYFPICLVKNKNICGRCPAADDTIRNYAYEVAVAQHCFPCRFENKGCWRKFMPKHIPEHERKCSFRSEKCPISDCTWENNLANLISHCEEEHSALMLKPNKDFDISLPSSSEIHQFLVYDNNLLRVSWEFDSTQEELGCLITHHQCENKKYACRLSLKYENRACLADFEMDVISKKNLKLLEGYTKGSKITGSIILAKSLQQLDELYKETPQTNMLLLLRCCKCTSYILPPIYALRNGSLACGNCTKEQSILSNVYLNNLAHSMEYPCKNIDAGCLFRGIPVLMELHQEVCQFSIVKCVYSSYEPICSWEDKLSKAHSHILENHEYINNGATVLFDISAKDNELSCSLIKYGSNFFELLYTFNADYCYWMIQKVEGVFGNFKYEIEISNKSGDRLVVRKSCPKYEEMFKLDDVSKRYNVCCIRKNQVLIFTKKIKEIIMLPFKISIFNDF